MKRRFIVLCLVLAAPGLLQSEVLKLRDGSVINGRLVRMESDTLYFETSFGSTLAIHRSGVVRIEFEPAAGSPAGEPLDGRSLQTAAEAGTLAVRFDDFQLTSRIVVKRGGDRDAYARANAIEQSLMVGDRKAHSVVDSLTDKIVRKGPETVLRNDAKPVDFKVTLPAGIYSCAVVFHNPYASEFEDSFDPSPLEKRLVLEPVIVEPANTTRLRVDLKRKWTGKTELIKRN